MSRILQKSFKYVPAAATDIRKTFERVRREMKQQAEKPANVRQLRKAAK